MKLKRSRRNVYPRYISSCVKVRETTCQKGWVIVGLKLFALMISKYRRYHFQTEVDLSSFINVNTCPPRYCRGVNDVVFLKFSFQDLKHSKS